MNLKIRKVILDLIINEISFAMIKKKKKSGGLAVIFGLM